jgi:hypothetical protein
MTRDLLIENKGLPKLLRRKKVTRVRQALVENIVVGLDGKV